MDYVTASLRKADRSNVHLFHTSISNLFKSQIQVTRRDEANVHFLCRVLFSLHAVNMSCIVHNNSGVELHERIYNQIAYEELQDYLQRD